MQVVLTASQKRLLLLGAVAASLLQLLCALPANITALCPTSYHGTTTWNNNKMFLLPCSVSYVHGETNKHILMKFVQV